MKLKYDEDADAAYVYLDEIPAGAAKTTVPWGEGPVRELFLDFDEDGKLLGIEILDASKLLTRGALNSAKNND